MYQVAINAVYKMLPYAYGLHPQDRQLQILSTVSTATNVTTFCVLSL